MNWILNFFPVLSLVYGWIQKLFNVKLLAFLLFKAILFFLFFKFLPLLFGTFFQWIYDLGLGLNSDVDLSFLQVLVSPEITGFPGWLFTQLKLDQCINIMVSGAIVRLGIKRLPFFN